MRAGGRLMVFAPDAGEVLQALQQLDGGSRRPVVQRAANLEDVFLSLTGTSLGEGQ